jgi:GT2 family glycosyltransferase
MQKKPLVSVVILNYNGLKYMGKGLKDCLDSVLKTAYPNFEVVFVDNGSEDSSADFVEESYGKRVKLVRNTKNLGFAEGFNSGIRVTKGKYLTLLSNDMTVHPSWLNPIVSLMDSNATIGLAGFKRMVRGQDNLLDGVGSDLYLCGRVKPIGTYEIDKGQFEANIDDLDFIGGAMTLRRETVQKVGLFDLDFPIFSEDVDLCFRIRRAGYKTVYVHDAVIWHRAHATLTGMDPKGLFMEYMANRNRVRFGIIHFTLKRLLSMMMIDSAWFMMTNSTSKMILLKAYFWNLTNITIPLKKRFLYGPSPPYGCKFPVTPFRFSDFQRRLSETLSV